MPYDLFPKTSTVRGLNWKPPKHIKPNFSFGLERLYKDLMQDSRFSHISTEEEINFREFDRIPKNTLKANKMAVNCWKACAIWRIITWLRNLDRR